MHDVYPLLKYTDFPKIHRKKLKTAQVNLGYKCNQSCVHCHVNASPKRKEEMSKNVMLDILHFVDAFDIKSVDLTGGAPELNKNFKYFVRELKKMGCHVIDRCNLTILLEKDQHGLAEFLSKNEVEIIASLPCYIGENVDKQRGKNVFQSSIKALKLLNDLGYGFKQKLKLNLVYNPSGPELPPSQVKLKTDYIKFLSEKYNVYFNDLYTITNMPIARFGSTLISKNYFNNYMKLLKNSFCEEAVKNVMCKSLVSIDYKGFIYDCDFNQMLNIKTPNGSPNVKDLPDILAGQKISTGDHCYGCTAGSGSSCGGSLV
tara:strand:- start:356 stop:1303 length:948 start_codon:yes stop_codon:yes gene_type:complete